MARNDFNGDGISDMLWLFLENVAVSNWLGSASGSFSINDGAAYRGLAAMHIFDLATTGDFNGDGRSDLLWKMDGGGWYQADLADPTGGVSLGGQVPLFEVSDASWRVAGAADFNGDGVDDLLWVNSDGWLSNWLGTPSGVFQINDANALSHVGNDWKVIGTGDFNGDGREDLLWLSTDGMMSNWLGTENGGFTINDHNALHRIPDWIDVEQIAVGQFTNDELDDLMIVTPQGDAFISRTYADGSFWPAWGLGFVSKVPVGGEMTAVGDYNGDHVDDILWRAGTTVSAWFGDPDTAYHPMTVNEAIANVPADWQIAAGGIFAG